MRAIFAHREPLDRQEPSPMNLAEKPSTLQSATDLNLDPYWMPFTHNRYFKQHHPLNRLHGERRGRVLHDGRRPAACSTACRACGAVRSGIGRRRSSKRSSSQLDRADYIPAFQVASPDTFRSGRTHRRRRAWRPEPRVLHQLGLRGRRYVAEDRAGLSPPERRSVAHALHRPREGLSRRRLRRHFGRRHGRRTARCSRRR